MTINGSNRPPQGRLGRVIMWCIFGIAAVLAIIAIVILVRSGTKLF
ncbi:MAG: hypothetical protein JWN36_1895 [Microbacteriaceae bacterium]|nr:hypothetical protein [Microbacteriaceae bacterium]